jgi:hypothetical protein
MGLQFGSTYQIRVDESGLRFDYLLNLKRSAEKLVVILPNAIPTRLREEGKVPYFPRMSWVEKIRHSVAIVNDPILFLDEQILIGWMLGTREAYATEICLNTVDQLLVAHGLSQESLILMGSSAGGFIGLVMGARRPRATVIADMPQTNIFAYWERWWQFALRVYLPGMTREQCLEEFPERFLVTEAFRKYTMPARTYYIQSLADPWHYQNHFLPFLRDLEGLPPEKRRNVEFHILLYDQGVEGHEPLATDKMLTLINSL